MGMQLFRFAADKPAQLRMPAAYRQTHSWTPRIGDIFPDFTAPTTQGPMRLFDWAEGSWSFLFSHPVAFSPVCTTEMITLAAAHAEFEACNTKLLGFTASSLAEQRAWHRDIETRLGHHIGFPTVEDADGQFAEAFGMYHPKESTAWPIRKSFILDPQMRIRMIFEYPLHVGRSTEEVLRTLEALQAVDAHGVATPADWYPGEPYLYAEKAKSDMARAVDHKTSRRLTSYLAFVAPQDCETTAPSDELDFMATLQRA